MYQLELSEQPLSKVEGGDTISFTHGDNGLFFRHLSWTTLTVLHPVVHLTWTVVVERRAERAVQSPAPYLPPLTWPSLWEVGVIVRLLVSKVTECSDSAPPNPTKCERRGFLKLLMKKHSIL